MKYQKILGLVATASLLLAGCTTDSDNSNTWLSDPNAVHVSASVGSIFTRSYPAASDEAKQMSFKSGDVMGVSNNGTSLNYTFNGTDWQPGNGSYLVWDKSDLKFQCWYPADGKNTFSKGYVQEDQSNTDVIAKSDYMTAAVTNLTEIPGDRQLKVAMERKTARLILNIQSFNDQFDANTTKVNHIRIASNASTEASETSTVNIKPLQKGEGGINTTYTALVIPGKVEGKLYFSADESTETPLAVKTGTLEAGKSYTYNLIVGKNKVAVNDITVADWTSGEITGGKAEEKYIPYVTFTAKDSQTFKMTEHGDYKISGLEYSVNDGKWTAVNASTVVTFGGAKGDLRLRGTKNATGTATDGKNYSKITFTNIAVNVSCTGDIRTLLDWENYTTVKTENARFCYLFDKCAVLTSAPKLPAETLADYCYLCMFSCCTSLKTAPELPAETLTKKCYNGMFFKCESLQTAPKLPAKTLADNCYYTMFKGCTNLEKAPELEATQLAYYCCSDMFNGCTNLKTAPILKAETLAEGCYYNMFNGCTNLKTAPELPAKTLTKKCYNGMFLGCQSLTSTPELKAEKLAESCYSEMFKGCTSLNSAQELKATTLADYCYFSMFHGCTNLEKAPKLEAITLANFCYMDMFNGCKKLSTVTMLAPSIQIRQKDFCCIDWLRNAGTSATSLTLKLQDKNAYDALKATSYLPTNWQIGKCTVLDENGMAIK